MTIGLLTSYLAIGEDTSSGIGQHYRILADALSAEGHQVHVFLCSENPVVAQEAIERLQPKWTCDIVRAQVPGWIRSIVGGRWPLQLLLRNIWMARAADKIVAAYIKTREIDVIETHAFGAPALFLLRRARRPKIVTRVSTTSQQTTALSTVRSRVFSWHAALERHVTHRSDVLVTHTVQHRDTLCLLEGHPPERFALVAHGLPEPFPPPIFSAEESNDAVDFLFVGRFETRKGIDVLLAAIPHVAAAFPTAKFTLAGSIGDGKEWQAFQLNHPTLAGSRVISLGHVSTSALTSLYRSCSIFVAPSRYESFGLIYAEAMSHGKPVIGCHAGGVPEVVTDGVTGLLASPGDVGDLVQCMSRLANSEALRREMGQAAREDFLNRFTARTLARNSVDLYMACLNRDAVPVIR